MKNIIDTTIAKYLEGKEREAWEMFCTKPNKWQDNENKLLNGIRYLTRRFTDAEEHEKVCIATLSAMCYDMLAAGKGYHSGVKCLKICDNKYKLKKGVGLCETIYFAAGGKTDSLSLGEELTTANEDLLAYFQSRAHVVKISKNANIYCYKDEEGSLILLNVNNINLPILCDEEAFNDSLPWYFTESTHFVSPVFELDIVTIIIRHLIDIVSYPHINIRHKVLYTGYNARLINEDDMWEEVWCKRDLENIMSPHRILKAQSRTAFTPSLLNIIKATGAIYDEIKKKDIYKPEQITEYINIRIKD